MDFNRSRIGDRKTGWKGLSLSFCSQPRSWLIPALVWIAASSAAIHDLIIQISWYLGQNYPGSVVGKIWNFKWRCFFHSKFQMGGLILSPHAVRRRNLFRRLPEDQVKKLMGSEYFALAWPEPTEGLRLPSLIADLEWSGHKFTLSWEVGMLLRLSSRRDDMLGPDSLGSPAGYNSIELVDKNYK